MSDEQLSIPQVIESNMILDSFISVKRERLVYPNQHERDYITVSSSEESVAVLARSDEGDILVTYEYRHAVRSVVLGCPGGLVDPGESILEAAKRELLEETGCQATHFELIGQAFPLPGILNQKMSIVLATGATRHALPNLEPTESIHSFFVSEEKLKQLILNQTATDGVLLSALYSLSLRA